MLSLQNEAVDVDIDEILDMDTDDIRRSHLFVSLSFAVVLKCSLGSSRDLDRLLKEHFKKLKAFERNEISSMIDDIFLIFQFPSTHPTESAIQFNLQAI